MTPRSKQLTTVAAAVASILAAASAGAQTVNWLAPGPGTFNWNTPASWSGSLLPGASNDVIINVAGTPTINYTTITSVINSLAVTNATLQVQSGLLTVTNGFTSNATTNVSGGELAIGGTASFATLGISGGTLRLNGASTVATLNQSGGQVQGTGDLTVTGPATITFGAYSGPGRTIVQGTTTIGGLRLDGGREFRNTGTVTQSFGADLNTFTTGGDQAGSGSIVNALGGVWNLTDSAGISASNRGVGDTGVGATFTNAGTLNRSGTGTSTVSVVLNSTGAINVTAGTLSLTGGGTISGNIGGAGTIRLGGSSANAMLVNGSVTTGGAAFGGAGVTTVSGNVTTGDATFEGSGTTTLSGSFAASNSTTVTGGTHSLTGPVTSLGSTLTVQGGFLNLGSANASVTTLNQSSGQLQGAGDLTVTGPAAITFGAYSGPGRTIVQGTTTIGSLRLDGGREFRNTGTVTQSAGADLNTFTIGTDQAGSGSIVNALGGVWNLTDSAQISASNRGVGDTGVGATFTNAGTLNRSGTGTSTVGVVLNSTGAINVTAGTLSLTGGGTISGNIGGAGTIRLGGSSANAMLVNGSVTTGGAAFGGAGVTTVSGNFTTGDATFEGSGTTTLSGSFAASNSTTVTNGTHSLTGPVTSLGSTLAVQGGLLNLGSANASVTTLNQSSGQLQGAGDLTVTGPATITFGGQSGPGRTIVQGATTISGSGLRLDGGREFRNTGTVTQSVSMDLNTFVFGTDQAGSGSIVNAAGGVWNITDSAQIFAGFRGVGDTGADATFTNAGTLNRSGTGTSTVSVVLNSTGAINVTAGTLTLNGGGTISGSIGGAGTIGLGGSSANAMLVSGSVNTANASFLGGGVTTVSGTYNVGGTTTVTAGTNNLTGPVTSLGSTLAVQGGLLNLGSANASVTTLNQSSGQLQGAGDLTVTGPATITFGGQSGPGRTIVQGATTISGSGLRLDGGREFRNTGTVTQSVSMDLNTFVFGTDQAGSGSIVNAAGGVWNITDFAQIFAGFRGVGDTGADATFTNAGTLNRSGTGTSTVFTSFVSTGTVNVTAGTLGLNGTSTLGGAINVAAGATLAFSTGTHAVNGTLSSPGTVALNSGDLSFNSSSTIAGTLAIVGGTLNLAAGTTTTTATLTQSGGQLQGGANLTVTGPATISFGGQSGSGQTLVQGATTISTSGLRLDGGRVFRNTGTVTQTASIDLNSRASGNAEAGTGSIVNALGGVWTVTGSNSIGASFQAAGDIGAGATFTNAGTFNRSGAGTTTTVSTTFVNTGTVDVQSGTLNLSDTSTLGGVIGVAAGATLSFSNGTHDVNGAVTAPGTVSISAGTVNFNASHTISGTTAISGGTTNLLAATTTTTGTLIHSGGQLRGDGDLTVTGPATISFGGQSGSGRTTVQGATTISGSGLRLDGGREFRNTGTVTQTAGLDLNARAFGSVEAGSGSVVNALGGVWNVTGSTSIIASFQGSGDTGAGATFTNAGTFDRSGGVGTTSTVSTTFVNTGTASVAAGTLAFSGTFTNGVGGTLQALGGATANFQSGVNVTNFAGGTLTGGIWRADSTNGLGTATISFQNANSIVTTNAADIYLVGADSVISGRNNVNAVQTLDQTLATNNGALRLQQGRTFNATANAGNFTNAAGGLLEITDSTFVSNALANNGTIAGFGNATVTTAGGSQITGNGAIVANSGVLTLTRGVSLGTGSSLASNAGATVNLSNASLASQVGTLSNGGSLNLGAQNVVVTQDYTNANFGSGNAFNALANVIGAGAIVGQNANQALVQAGTATELSSTGANAYVLNLGNVRGGTQATQSFDIRNTGTGASIRGALQTVGPIDARLSGSGVTAANFGPVAQQSNTGPYAVTLTGGTAGGALSSTVQVVSNFGNVVTDTLTINGFSSVLAVGNATPNSPPTLDLGNFRLGVQGPATALTVANQTSGAGAERLGVNSVAGTTGFAGTNVLGSGLLGGGASQAGAITVRADGNGVVGANNGTITITYATDGTAIDAGFVRQAANVQQIAVTAVGWELAQGSATPAPVNLGNFRVGTAVGASPQSQAIAVSNAAGIAREDLGVGSATLGGAQAGTFTLTNNLLGTRIDAGTSFANALTIARNGTAGVAGANSGTVAIQYVSDGAGTSGLATIDANAQNVAVTATGYNAASGAASTTTVNLGNFRVGVAGGAAPQSQNVGVTNTVAGPFTESLGLGSAVLGGTQAGTFQLTNNLGAGLVAAGATNASALTIARNGTAGVAGANSSTIAIQYRTDGAGTSGLAAANVNGQVVNVSATGFNVANGGLGASVVNLGNFRVGLAGGAAPQSQNVGVTNTVAGPNTEGLGISSATLGGAQAGTFALTNNLGAGLVAAGGTNAGALTIARNGTAGGLGLNTGTVNVAFTSDGAGTSGLAAIAANGGSFTVNATGFQLAQGSATPTPINLGNFRVGTTVGASPQSQGIDVANAAGAFRESLAIGSATLGGAQAATFALTNNLGAGLVAAGGSSANALSIARAGTAGVAGLNTGAIAIQYRSDGTGTSGLAAIDANTQNVAVTATGFNAANGAASTTTVNLGNFRVGTAVAVAPQSANVGVTNTVAGPFTEGLGLGSATLGGANPGTFTLTNNLGAGLVAAGATNASALTIARNGTAGVAGANSSTIAIQYRTDGAGTSGLAAANVNAQNVTVNASGFVAASGAIVTPAFNFGTLQVGQQVTQALTIANTATGPAGFVEDLNASFGASTDGQIAGLGSIGGVRAGTNSGATGTGTMTVQVTGATAGALNGSIRVNYATAGAVNGVSNGLGTASAGFDDFGVSGTIQTVANVVNQARPVTNGVTSPAAVTVNLGNIRAGGSFATQTLSVQNAILNPAVDQAALTASIASNGAPVTAGGSFSLLAPGATSTALSVGLTAASAATAGAKTGTAAISFVSDASNIGNCAPNCAVNLPSQTVNVAGNVFRLASGDTAGTPVNLGNFRVGTNVVLNGSAGVTNTAAADGFSEQLGVSGVGSGNAAFTASNVLGVTRVNAGATASGAVGVSVNTTGLAAGSNASTITVNYLSDGTASGTGAPIAAGSSTFQASATGWNAAAGSATPNPVNLGSFRVGLAGGASPQTASIGVSNTVAGPNTEGLGIGSATLGGANPGTFTLTNNLGAGLVAAGGTNAAALTIARNGTAGVLGVNTGTVAIQFTTDGAGTSGLAAANVNAQNVTVNSTGYQLAQGSATPTPINLGNFRVGTAVGASPQSQGIDVANAAGAFRESLGIGSATLGGANPGTFALTNNLGAGLVAAGATNAGALTIARNGTAGVAGVNTSAITIQYRSDGAGTSGLAAIDANQQSVAVSASGFLAASGAIQTAALNFGVVQVGQSVTQNLVIRNTATGPAGFVEDLNAAFGTATDARITGTGTLAGILAGTNSTGANGLMTVGVNTGSAGTVNGSIRVNYTTAGAVAGVSNGLGTADAGFENYGVQGTIETTATVVNQAQPRTNGVAPPTAVAVNLGNVREGGAFGTQSLTVANALLNPAQQQATLTASLASNGAPVTVSGAITQLAAGGTSTALSVGLGGASTATAGARAGSATLGFVSDAGPLGCTTNCTLDLGTQTVNVTGGVYRLASGDALRTTPIDLGAFRVGLGGPSGSGSVAVTNTAANDGFSEQLGIAGVSTGDARFVASNTLGATRVNAGATANGAIGVTAGSGFVAGVNTGTVTVQFLSDGTASGTGSPVNVAGDSFGVTARGYTAAVGQLNTGATLDFGTVRRGTALAAQDVSITNAAAVTALNDTLRGTLAVGSTPGGAFSGNGQTVAGIGAGAANAAGSLAIAMDTGTAGTKSGSAQVTFASENPELIALALGSSSTIALTGTVNEIASAVFSRTGGAGSFTGGGTSYTLDLGDLILGDGATSVLALTNAVAGPADALIGAFGLGSLGDFGASGFTNLTVANALGAGGVLGGLNLSFTASTLGLYTGNFTFGGASYNPFQSDFALSPITVNLRANVIDRTNVEVPEPGTLGLGLLGLGGLLWARRRRLLAVARG